MPYWYIDTGMASGLMLQTVVDEGLRRLDGAVLAQDSYWLDPLPTPSAVRRRGNVRQRPNDQS
jgi:hypothetical protein